MADTRDFFDGEVQGGFNAFPDRATKKIFFGSKETETKVRTILSGQVIKAYTWLESDNSGKLKVHSNIAETNKVTFNSALVSTNTVVVSITGAAASITFTVGSAGATAAQLAQALDVLTPAMTTTAANTALLAAGIPTTVGTYTSMTVGAPDFNTEIQRDGITVLFNAASALTNATDLTIATTGTVHTLVLVAGTTTFAKIAGLTVFDVDATAGDRDAAVYLEGSFHANDDGTCALRWASYPGETMTKADGTTVALTAYNTGCAGVTAASNLLKQKFAENSDFELYFTAVGAKS